MKLYALEAIYGAMELFMAPSSVPVGAGPSHAKELSNFLANEVKPGGLDLDMNLIQHLPAWP